MCRNQPLTVPRSGSRAVLSRWETLAAEFETSLQDLQSPQYHSRLISSPTRTYLRGGCYHSGFADVSYGEYLGLPVAVKSLRTNNGDSPKSFKVFLMHFVYCCCSFHPAILPRSHLLETFVPSKYLAIVRNFCICRPTQSQHSN